MKKHHENTATRLRPKSFKQLVGQEFIVSTICNSIEQSHNSTNNSTQDNATNYKQGLAPAYLFSGPRGVGKTSAARLVALAINRPEGTDIDNLFYEGSEDIRLGSALDVIEIDGASYTSVENIRKIQEDVSYAPVHFKYKVFIIDEVHMLSNSAFNALLKTIEEPPAYVIFIFATTELHKVPATIKSRCQQFTFHLIKNAEIIKQLEHICKQENIDADRLALQWIAKESQGSFRDAYTIFDQVKAFSNNTISLETIEKHLGLTGMDVLNEIFLTCLESNRSAILQHIDAILSKGVSTEQFVMDAAEYVRNLLFLKSNLTSSEILGMSADLFNNKIHTELSMAQLEKALALLLECYRNLRYSVNPRFEVELVFGQFCELSHYITPQALVKQLKQAKASQTMPQADVPPSPQPSPQNPSQTDAPHPSQPPSQQTEHTNETDTTHTSAEHTSLQPPSMEEFLEEHPPSDIHPTPVEDNSISLWDTIMVNIRNSNENVALVLDSASAKQAGHILYLSFNDEYSYNKYKAYAEKVNLLANKIAKQDITIEASIVQNNNAPSEIPSPISNPAIPMKKETIPKQEGERKMSDEASNILNEFGGTKQETK